MDLSPRRIVLLGLAAIIPGTIFAVGTGDYTVVVALVNVVVIVASLVVAMTDSNGTEPAPSDGTEPSPSNGDPVG